MNDKLLQEEISAALQTKENTDEAFAKSFDAEDLRSKQIENKSKEQDIEQRKQFANKIYWLVSVYLGVVCLIIILCACPIPFAVSDTVLGIILGTTTANVLALFHFVARYLFSEKQLK